MSEVAKLQCAYAAVSFVLGRRGAALVGGFQPPSTQVVQLVRRLSHKNQDVRARALAAELGRVIAALGERAGR